MLFHTMFGRVVMQQMYVGVLAGVNPGDMFPKPLAAPWFQEYTSSCGLHPSILEGLWYNVLHS
jgi:hypothetical protein